MRRQTPAARLAPVAVGGQVCPNCPRAAAHRMFLIGPGNAVVRCDSCQLQYAQRYPELATEGEQIYSEAYFERAIEQGKQREAVFGELLTELEQAVGRPGRLLDIGAGEGTLLVVARRRGWTAEGTEISSAMVERVRERLNLVIHHGELEQLKLQGQSYDAIVMNHVLEHVKNPKTTLESAARLLSPSGVLRIEVPNLAGLSSRAKNLQSRYHLKQSPWKHYSVDHHFWFFTPATLRRTLAGAGLEVIRILAPAKQWGHKSLADRVLNEVYGRGLWGGHLVAYARQRNAAPSQNRDRRGAVAERPSNQ